MNKGKKQRIFDMIRGSILLVAVLVMFYPTISNYLYVRNSSMMIAEYTSQTQGLTEEEINRLLEQANEYNQSLLDREMLSDPFSLSEKNMENHLLDISKSGIIAYIQIPKLNLELPIYYGTKKSTLQKGIGVFEGSSLPIGGESTHTVLAGHSGLSSAELFTHLDQLEIGSVFYIKVLTKTLAYEVDQILVVTPEETEALSIVEGEDYVTLVTCTPYAVNTHRLLVRGHRIAYQENVVMTPSKIDRFDFLFEIRVPILSVLCLILLWVIRKIIRMLRRKKKKSKTLYRLLSLNDFLRWRRGVQSKYLSYRRHCFRRVLRFNKNKTFHIYLSNIISTKNESYP